MFCYIATSIDVVNANCSSTVHTVYTHARQCLITTLNFHTYLPIAADFPLAQSQTTVTFNAVNSVFATKFCFVRN